MKTYQLVTKADDSSVKGGLSHANGNCIMVTRLTDGSYTVTDSKLGAASPVWPLSANQFHRLGQLIIRWLNWVIVDGIKTAELSDGLVFTVRSTSAGYVFSLTGQPDLIFDAEEYRAFCWGHMFGQFPLNKPVKTLYFRGSRQPALS